MKHVYLLLRLQFLFLLCVFVSAAMRSFSHGSWITGALFLLVALALFLSDRKGNKMQYWLWFISKRSRMYHCFAIVLLLALIVGLWLEDGCSFFTISLSGALGMSIGVHCLLWRRKSEKE